MNLTRTRRLVPLAVAALLAGIAAAPATADSIKAPPVVLAADVINSPLGFFGCFRVDGLENRICFATQRIVDGPDAGAVSVTTRVVGRQLLSPDAVFEQVVAPTALERVSDYHLRFQTHVEGVGTVDLNLLGDTRHIESGTNTLHDAVTGEVVGPLVVGQATWIYGTIAGHELGSYISQYPVFWVGPAAGSWFMDLLA